ncbi:MAG: RdgB/HAM1 family non-canonical purine NTP pyrophosphatase [Chloroflexi bacterium]|jgi:XTP/dITP diphosphohydrolase|nr:RdgB/HAM1 family non-canonical purine NTP pyrophosphatase [Chloroflexota bacterium]
MSAVAVLMASNNAHKRRELGEIFALAGLREVVLITPDELGVRCEPEESGTSYLANALIKAQALAKAYRDSGGAQPVWILADDSGLEVDALGGQPGVHSARYYQSAPGGDGCAALLAAMAGVPDAQRSARFRCVLVLISPEGDVHHFEGVCEGQIAHERRGTGGFGFDPVFVVADGRTMAELSAAEKHAISHRGIAGRQAAAFLRQVMR